MPRSPAVLLSLITLLVVPCSAVAQTRSPVGPDSRWSLAAVGDVIMNRRIGQFDQPADPAFHEMANVIRGADAAFMNLEQSVFRLQDFDGWPAAENGGNYEVGSPETLRDLVDMGFNLFNRANNHTTDYGVEGMRLTNRLMDEWGLVHAGTGENLAWARRNEGSPVTMRALRDAARAQGANVSDDSGSSVRTFGATFFPGKVDRVVVSLNDTDRARVLHEVTNAADQGDYVVVNSHSHEPGNGSQTPPEWMVEFTHQAIDAGANTFIIHGPHQLRGIEIYNGRPIFYSLGNFIFQNETIDPMPSDQRDRLGIPLDQLASEIYDRRFRVDGKGNATTGFPTGSQWYESVVAVASFEGEEVVEIRLYPIELGWEEPRSQRGTPRIAPEALGRKIIEHLAELSRPFGTEIRYEGGVGVWHR
jgi:poly-gamma-glutamate capsule biosynthesis protein CapA/YwtB (metallophosphatase superfamily)